MIMPVFILYACTKNQLHEESSQTEANRWEVSHSWLRIKNTERFSSANQTSDPEILHQMEDVSFTSYHQDLAPCFCKPGDNNNYNNATLIMINLIFNDDNKF